MTIEDIIKANTAALIENTAALREILSVGASTAAVQAVPEPVKKKTVAKKAESKEEAPHDQTLPKEEPKPEKEETLEESVEKFHKEVNGAPDIELPESPEEPSSETIVAPDLPPTELRAKLKEEIKLRIMGDPAFKNHFESCREKYGIALVKDLTDDQLPGFYAEVLAV